MLSPLDITQPQTEGWIKKKKVMFNATFNYFQKLGLKGLQVHIQKVHTRMLGTSAASMNIPSQCSMFWGFFPQIAQHVESALGLSL